MRIRRGWRRARCSGERCFAGRLVVGQKKFSHGVAGKNQCFAGVRVVRVVGPGWFWKVLVGEGRSGLFGSVRCRLIRAGRRNTVRVTGGFGGWLVVDRKNFLGGRAEKKLCFAGDRVVWVVGVGWVWKVLVGKGRSGLFGSARCRSIALAALGKGRVFGRERFSVAGWWLNGKFFWAVQRGKTGALQEIVWFGW